MNIWVVKCSVCEQEWREESAAAPIRHPGVHGGLAPDHEIVKDGVEVGSPCIGSGQPRIVQFD